MNIFKFINLFKHQIIVDFLFIFENIFFKFSAHYSKFYTNFEFNSFDNSIVLTSYIFQFVENKKKLISEYRIIIHLK